MICFVIIDCYAQSSFKDKIKSFLPSNHREKIEQKEFPIGLINSLSVDNHKGSITIKTGPQKSIFLRATKHAHKTLIDTLEIATTTINSHHLAITTHNNTKKKHGFVEYELIVPDFINIALNITGKGSICIKDVQGAIDVMAHDHVTIINTKKLASIQTIKKGSITITNAQGPIEAYTQKGSIIAQNLTHTCDARSLKGKINLSYKKLPPTSSINLSSASGNITLALPTQTNAKICGNTTYGTFTSDHEIMLNSYTTKLDKNAWKYFTQHVEGSLGNAKDAAITINSISGNVKIVENKIT